jgi:glycosyltransferase involved in cell wall biosynthesis
MSTPQPLTISVVTPSYKQPDWLRLCAASVADQAGENLTVEHIVQDSLSGPGIADILQPFPKAKLFSEKDAGMYDAINRGWEKATGDILCWLNCDEQYLPGALAKVADYFRLHPETEVLFGDAFVVNPAGRYICSRQVLVPLKYHSWICHLGTLSCATFFRRDLVKARGFMLDTRWKSVGDADLIVRLLRARVEMRVLRQYLSVFVDTGENMSLGPVALREMDALAREAPAWAQAFRRYWVLLHRARRMAFGLYAPKPFATEIYTSESPRQRLRLDVPHPTFHWKGRVDWRS